MSRIMIRDWWLGHVRSREKLALTLSVREKLATKTGSVQSS